MHGRLEQRRPCEPVAGSDERSFRSDVDGVGDGLPAVASAPAQYLDDDGLSKTDMLSEWTRTGIGEDRETFTSDPDCVYPTTDGSCSGYGVHAAMCDRAG